MIIKRPSEAPKVEVKPSEAQVFVQHIPAPEVKVEVNHKPCAWDFSITRDKFGRIASISAKPKM